MDQSKQLTVASISMLASAATLAGRQCGTVTAHGPLSAAEADLLIGGTAPPTVNTYTRSLDRFWKRHMASRDTTPSFPIPDAGSLRADIEALASDPQVQSAAGSKTLIAAVDFFARIAGLPSPGQDRGVQTARGAILRRKGLARAKKAPLFADDITAARSQRESAPSPSSGPATQFSWSHDPWEAILLFIEAATLRYDDLRRVQLADLAWLGDRVEFPLVGTKTDKSRTGQRASIPRSDLPASACARLLQLLSEAARRLCALEDGAREALFAGASAALTAAAPPLRLPHGLCPHLETLASLRLASGLPLPVGALPLFGRWNTAPVLPTVAFDSNGAGAFDPVPYPQILRRVKALAASLGLNPRQFGVHSLRRGGTTAMQAAGASRTQLATALRHRSLASTMEYESGAASQMALTRIRTSDSAAMS